MRFFLPVLLLVAGISGNVCAQGAKSCCAPTATEKFAALGHESGFSAVHREPDAFQYLSDHGEKISLPVEDGEPANAWFLKAQEPTDKYLFVFHEWWGLNDHIKEEAERLYEDLGNINVLALDLYDGKVASTQEEAQKYMQATSDARGRAIIEAATAYAGKDARIGTLGWCFGGGWSLQAAILLGDKADACVMYYGMPEMDTEKLAGLETDVLAIFGSQDNWISREKAREFEKRMEEAGEEVNIQIYDAGHAFANPSNPGFDSEATREAYELVQRYLRDKLN